MRTLEQSLARAESLRKFRDVNKERFERNDDLRDIVLLADEIERLKARRILSESVSVMGGSAIQYSIVDADDPRLVKSSEVEDDHDESW